MYSGYKLNLFLIPHLIVFFLNVQSYFIKINVILLKIYFKIFLGARNNSKEKITKI